MWLLAFHHRQGLWQIFFSDAYAHPCRHHRFRQIHIVEHCGNTGLLELRFQHHGTLVGVNGKCDEAIGIVGVFHILQW